MSYKSLLHNVGGRHFKVYKIQPGSYCRTRWFCIFDRDLPFELSFKYKELAEGVDVGYGFGKNTTVLFTPTIKPVKEYTFRFRTIEEAQDHVKEIEKKKNLVIEAMLEEQDSFLSAKRSV